MVHLLDRLPSRQPDASSCPDRRRASDRGFSLAEVLVATLLLAGGMTAVAQLLVVSIQQHQLGQRSSEAATLAQSKLENLVKRNFTTDPAIQISPANALSENVNNFFDQAAGGYTRRWLVQAGPAPDTRVLTLLVIPPSVDRTRFKQVQLTTIIRQW